MGNSRTGYDCDLVIEMDDMGIGVEEILQYARASLRREEVRALIRGLEDAATLAVADEA